MSEAIGHPEYLSETPERVLKKVESIISENLYLADKELHEAALNFLLWAHRENDDERYQIVMKGKYDDKPYVQFKKILYSQYQETKKQYLKS